MARSATPPSSGDKTPAVQVPKQNGSGKPILHVEDGSDKKKETNPWNSLRSVVLKRTATEINEGREYEKSDRESNRKKQIETKQGYHGGFIGKKKETAGLPAGANTYSGSHGLPQDEKRM